MKIQTITKNLLLAFVLITIGFALGKEYARRQAPPAPIPEAPHEASADTRVVVYYTHATMRCETCNTIELLAEQAVDDHFAEELATGRVTWRVVNYEEDEAFAEHYGIGFSCVVVAGLKGNTETGFERLAEVWTKLDDPPAFEAYVAEAVQRLLSGDEGTGP